MAWIIALAAVWIVGGYASGGQNQTAPDKRESIFDRVVHLEKDILTEIPPVGRLCDGLTLDKKRVNIGDAELYVEEEGRGTPLVLINGGPGGTHHGFHPWFSRAKDFARVVYYDQRGCGLSDYRPGPNGYTVEQAVDDLEALRKALGYERWVVLGYSYGGFLAQYYATRYPESLSGMILLGALPGMWVKMKPTRQNDFISAEEKARINEVYAKIGALAEERKWAPDKAMALRVYNAHLNGDWKRQRYYRSFAEECARRALYEWNFDMVNNFRGISSSLGKVDLTGAFEGCPIPTLILEGRWDLTWNTDKPEILAANHPGAKMVLFEKAGHGIYDEETDRFFGVLRDFLTGLSGTGAPDVSAYKKGLAQWDAKRRTSPLFIIKTNGNGMASSARIAQAYKPAWGSELQEWPMEMLKLGTSLYDVKKYAEALFVFEKLAESGRRAGNKDREALASIWQGHMLDLLGKRQEAIHLYQRAAEADDRGTWEHSQYGLRYRVSDYARERMAAPFVRIENKRED
jgi:proline iminopeptidase